VEVGGGDSTKDKDERFVPIHPRIRPLVEALPRSSTLLLPGVRDRRLLAQLKSACAAAGLGRSYKVHSLRHHFASMVANHGVSYKKALAWMGHADSEMLSNYYHLHDEESERSMQALAWDRSIAATIAKSRAESRLRDEVRRSKRGLSGGLRVPQ
jgi:integrase